MRQRLYTPQWPYTPYDTAYFRARTNVRKPSDFSHLNVMPFLPETDADDAAWVRYIDIVGAKSK